MVEAGSQLKKDRVKQIIVDHGSFGRTVQTVLDNFSRRRRWLSNRHRRIVATANASSAHFPVKRTGDSHRNEGSG
jgi:hypothetical protein